MKKLSEVVVNSRRGLIVGALALVAACGGDPAGGDSPDAGASSIDAVSAHPCEAIGDDPTPTGAVGPLDGIYTEAYGDANGVRPMCTVADDQRHVYSYYLEIDRGRVIAYRRSYLPNEPCGTAFDAGGVKEIIEETVLRACGPSYTTADGSFQQVVELGTLADGTRTRWYRFFGEGPTDTRWREVILSGLSGSNPFEAPPDDIHFLTFRRP